LFGTKFDGSGLISAPSNPYITTSPGGSDLISTFASEQRALIFSGTDSSSLSPDEVELIQQR
jgi:hypothetical protein